MNKPIIYLMPLIIRKLRTLLKGLIQFKTNDQDLSYSLGFTLQSHAWVGINNQMGENKILSQIDKRKREKEKNDIFFVFLFFCPIGF